MNLIFGLCQTGIFQVTQALTQVQTGQKIKFIKLDTYFKLEFCKNQVQTDRGIAAYAPTFFGYNNSVLAIVRVGS